MRKMDTDTIWNKQSVRTNCVFHILEVGAWLKLSAPLKYSCPINQADHEKPAYLRMSYFASSTRESLSIKLVAHDQCGH